MGRSFTLQMDNDPKHTEKATQDLLEAQKLDQVSHMILNWQGSCSVTENGAEGIKTKKQVALEGSYGEDLEQCLQGEHSAFSGVHFFNTSLLS